MSYRDFINRRHLIRRRLATFPFLKLDPIVSGAIIRSSCRSESEVQLKNGSLSTPNTCDVLLLSKAQRFQACKGCECQLASVVERSLNMPIAKLPRRLAKIELIRAIRYEVSQAKVTNKPYAQRGDSRAEIRRLKQSFERVPWNPSS